MIEWLLEVANRTMSEKLIPKNTKNAFSGQKLFFVAMKRHGHWSASQKGVFWSCELWVWGQLGASVTLWCKEFYRPTIALNRGNRVGESKGKKSFQKNFFFFGFLTWSKSAKSRFNCPPGLLKWDGTNFFGPYLCPSQTFRPENGPFFCCTLSDNTMAEF